MKCSKCDWPAILGLAEKPDTEYIYYCGTHNPAKHWLPGDYVVAHKSNRLVWISEVKDDQPSKD